MNCFLIICKPLSSNKTTNEQLEEEIRRCFGKECRKTGFPMTWFVLTKKSFDDMTGEMSKLLHPIAEWMIQKASREIITSIRSDQEFINNYEKVYDK